MSSTPHSAVPKPTPHDQIKFGMDISPQVGCCVDKVKTGRTGGCCAHIPHTKFVMNYLGSVQKKVEDGMMLTFDPEMTTTLLEHLDRIEKEDPGELNIQMLRKLLTTQTTSEAPPEPKKPEKTDTKSDKAKAFSIIRFFKNFFKGFWEDLKLIFSGKRQIS